MEGHTEQLDRIMPKLHRRKYDHSYYIRASILGGRGLVTWQVKPSGLDRLSEHGIGDKDDIPASLFHQLQQDKLIYTAGSGLLLPPDIELIQQPVAAGDVDLKGAVRLTLVEAKPERWQLRLLFPELPRTWSASIRRLEAVLNQVSFQVEGYTTIHGMRFWPGTGGASVEVQPQTERYVIRPEGAWPEFARIEQWAA